MPKTLPPQHTFECLVVREDASRWVRVLGATPHEARRKASVSGDVTTVRHAQPKTELGRGQSRVEQLFDAPTRTEPLSPFRAKRGSSTRLAVKRRR